MRERQATEKVKEKQNSIEKLIAELILHEKQLKQQCKENERLKKKVEMEAQIRKSTEITHNQLLQIRFENEKNVTAISQL